MAKVGETSESSSFQSGAESAVAGKSRVQETMKKLGGQIRSRVADIPSYGRTIAKQVDQRAHDNPWMSIGIASIGALALGYAIGRGFSSSRPSASVSSRSRTAGLMDLADLEVDD